MDIVARLTASLAGRYDIERELGVGGMATVYLARDVKHSRYVAVKVLKPELGVVLGPERFLTEIQVTANLQHPNLLPLFDSGEAAGLLYYVMPFVEGETLRDRLNREQQLPLEDALNIAIAVASALEYAHGRGVIHRDLKPENILMQAGQPIVADFGIALAVSNAGGQRVTQTGLSLGTPQYMSPEQATGERAVDARADIFSLGAVVYEMLTGEPPHLARTAQATIAKLLTEPARSITTLRRSVPAHVDAAVLHALEKLPADRFASARAFADALQAKGSLTASREAHTHAPQRARRRMVVGAIAVGAVAIAVAIALVMRPTDFETGGQTTRYPLAFRGDAKFASGAGIRFAISADGSQIAYVAGGSTERLYLKTPDDLEPKPIAGTEGASNPQFSPDGQWVAFLVDSKLAKVRLPGGAPVTIVDSVDRFSWGDHDVVVFARNTTAGRNSQSLFRVSASGGPVEKLASPDSVRREVDYSWPQLLPGAQAALFNLTKGISLDAWEIAAIRLDDKSIVLLNVPGLNPRYVPTGHIVYTLANRTLMAVPFDAKRLVITGPAVAVLENIRVRGQGASQFAVSANGTLVYVNETPPMQLTRLNRAGNREVLVRDSVGVIGGPRYSPDEQHLAYVSIDARGGFHIFTYAFATGIASQLTTDGASSSPSWTADGRRLAWFQRGGTTRWQPLDRSAPATVLLDSAGDVQFSPTGKYLTASTRQGRFLMMLDRPQQRVPLQSPDEPGANALEGHAISPDGKWMAYASRGTSPGSTEVFVRAIPGPGGRYQVTTDGGHEPRWGASSNELLFRNRGWLWSATLITSPAFEIVKRDSLFAMNVPENQSRRPNYDVSHDGKYFVMPWFMREENPPPVLVTNWFSELTQKMAAASVKP